MCTLCIYAWVCQGNTSTKLSLKPGAQETFIMQRPQVINELSTTSVVCASYCEIIKIHKKQWWPGYNYFTLVTLTKCHNCPENIFKAFSSFITASVSISGERQNRTSKTLRKMHYPKNKQNVLIRNNSGKT